MTSPMRSFYLQWQSCSDAYALCSVCGTLGRACIHMPSDRPVTRAYTSALLTPALPPICAHNPMTSSACQVHR